MIKSPPTILKEFGILGSRSFLAWCGALNYNMLYLGCSSCIIGYSTTELNTTLDIHMNDALFFFKDFCAVFITMYRSIFAS